MLKNGLLVPFILATVLGAIILGIAMEDGTYLAHSKKLFVS